MRSNESGEENSFVANLVGGKLEVKSMEFVLIQRMIGLAPPEASKALIEIGKKRKELCPQAKEIVAYWSMFDQVGFCVWEAPSIEVFEIFTFS